MDTAGIQVEIQRDTVDLLQNCSMRIIDTKIEIQGFSGILGIRR